MSKKIITTIIVLFTITFIGLTLFKDTEIDLLKQTPIGSSMEEVAIFCKKEGFVCKKSDNTGYLNQDLNKVIGKKCMWGVVYERKIFWFITITKQANWGFDQEGNLIDIWVWTTIDAI